MSTSLMMFTPPKRKAKLHGKAEYLVLIKQWIHQGFTYLDRTEMIYRIIWECIPTVVLCGLFLRTTSLSVTHSILLAGFSAHTLNWIFNFNFWTCITFTFPKVTNPGAAPTIRYLQKLQDRMRQYDSIGGCMLYGSISRGKWHEKSDLDMRILRKPGRINGLCAYLIVFCERVRAVFAGQPLDLYLADTVQFLNKMRKDEFPVFLKNEDPRLIARYRTVGYTDFGSVKDLNQCHAGVEHTLGL